MNGNLSSLTPPGRSAHALGYTAENREASYAPPNLPSGATPTSYTFDTDGRLTRVTRPDGIKVDLAYDGTSRLSSLTLGSGVLSLSYDAAARVVGTTAPGELGLTYTYDGGLLAGSTSNGAVFGFTSRNGKNRTLRCNHPTPDVALSCL